MALFRIKVTEYSSISGAPGPGISLPDCVINDRQLTIGMVRSTLTLNPGRAVRKLMAAMVRPTLLFILDWNRSPDLSLNVSALSRTRDFSVTTRLGELAQGVCYSYWHWQTGYRFVADFASLMNTVGIPVPPGSKEPDYIMFDPSTGTVALMEAKGTQGQNHAPQMTAALRQVRGAAVYAPADRGIACVLTLDQPSGKGVLHLRDPEGSRTVTDEMRHEIFRCSYAPWFDLTGDEEAAHWCRTPLARAQRLGLKHLASPAKGDANARDPLRNVVADALGFEPNLAVFQLDPVIVEALTSIVVFRDIGREKRMVSSVQDSLKPGSAILFPDGTAILPE